LKVEIDDLELGFTTRIRRCFLVFRWLTRWMEFGFGGWCCIERFCKLHFWGSLRRRRRYFGWQKEFSVIHHCYSSCGKDLWNHKRSIPFWFKLSM